MQRELNWILEAANRQSVAYTLLDDQETQDLISGIESRFLVPPKGKPIWERVKNPVARKSGNAWSLACDFVGNHLCYLIVEEPSAARALRIPGGSNLKSVLGDCPAFEFSLCGLEKEYLLSANHHDYLIAAGSASKWLRGL